MMFNLGDADRVIEAHVGRELLQSNGRLQVKGADGRYEDGKLKISTKIPAMSAAVVCIGDAADAFSEA